MDIIKPMSDPKSMHIYHDAYEKLEKGEYCLSGLMKVIVSDTAPEDDAILAYSVLTAWLAKNEPDKYADVLAIIRPVMQKNHPNVMKEK